MSTKHPLPELKKWTQRNLKPEDYDFLPLQDSPRHVLAAVWHWEVDRELGSRKGPFMVNKQCMLWMSKQCAREPMPSPALRIRSVREVISELKAAGIGHIPDPLNGGNLPSGNDFAKIYAVEIDWTRPQADIRREFSKWLANEGPAGKKGGKKAQYFRLLTNLGLRRLLIAGIRLNDELPDGYQKPYRLDKKGQESRAFFNSEKEAVKKQISAKLRKPIRQRNHAHKKKAETSIQDRWHKLTLAVESFAAEHIDAPSNPKGMLTRSPGSYF